MDSHHRARPRGACVSLSEVHQARLWDRRRRGLGEYRALQARDAFVNEHGKEPTIDEIAKKIDLPREDVIFALDAIADPISLFEPISNESGDPVYMMDMVGDEKYGEKTWLESLNIREGLSKLGEREKKIINLRFFVGKTQMEVAEEIGISQAQVSRLEKGALMQLRKYI